MNKVKGEGSGPLVPTEGVARARTLLGVVGLPSSRPSTPPPLCGLDDLGVSTVTEATQAN